MSSSSTVYSHRPMQPSGVRVHPPQHPPAGHTRPMSDSIDAIKRMFDGVNEDLARERCLKDEMEARLHSQVSELNIIRRALFDLEVEHSRVCQQYEDELHRLRSESVAIVQGNAPPPHQSAAALGIPGLARGPGPSATSLRFYGPRPDCEHHTHHTHHTHHQQQPQQPSQRPMSRGMPPPGDPEPEQSDRKRANSSDRDADRLSDQRESKRHKARRDSHLEMYPPPMGVQSHSHSPQQPHVPGSASSSSTIKASSSTYINPNYPLTYLSTAQDTGGPSSSSSGSGMPPVNSASPREELTPQNAPPEFRKDGEDWTVIYNPRVRRSLELSLVHSFTHPNVVCCVQFSSDGRYLATGCNRVAQIYDVQTGAKVCVLEDKTAPKDYDLYIRSVRFSPDGKLLATGAEDAKIRLWDIARKRVIHYFEGHKQEIFSLDFSRDGRHIVSGSGDKTLRIWNIVDASCRTITITEADSLNNDTGMTSVAISPDGTIIAAGGLDSPIRVWDVATGTLLERLRGHADSVYTVAFTPDGKGIVSGSLDNTLKYWDITNLVNTFTNKVKDNQSRDVSHSPLSISPPTSATLNFIGHKDYVLSVCVSEETRWVVSGSKDRTVHFWDGKNSDLQFVLHGHRNSVISLDLHPLGGNMLATGSGDNTARIWTLSPVSTSAPSSSSRSFSH